MLCLTHPDLHGIPPPYANTPYLHSAPDVKMVGMGVGIGPVLYMPQRQGQIMQAKYVHNVHSPYVSLLPHHFSSINTRTLHPPLPAVLRCLVWALAIGGLFMHTRIYLLPHPIPILPQPPLAPCPLSLVLCP